MSAVFDSIVPLFRGDETLRVDYPWDGWRSTFYFMVMDEDLAATLEGLSHAAQSAFVLANAEWICARHFRDPASAEVLSYIDAAWAGELTGAPVLYQEFPEPEWQGPVLGPLCYAQLIVANQHFEGGRDGATAARASWARHLALHVLGPAQRVAFDRWTAACLAVLTRDHPYEAPRWTSIFDPGFSTVDRCPPDALASPDSYRREDIDRSIDAHMRKVTGSPFLAGPTPRG